MVIKKNIEINKINCEIASEITGVAMWSWNLLSKEIWLSSQWKRMLGFEEYELENDFKIWSNRIHPDDQKQFLSLISARKATKTNFYETEYRIRSKNGNWKWILDKGKVTEKTIEGGKIVIGVCSDITNQKNKEYELLEELKKLKSRNVKRYGLYRNATRELRTPLATILMLSDIVLNYPDKMNESSFLQKLKTIRNKTIQISNIVDDIEVFTDLLDRNIQINIKEEDIIALFIEIVNQFNRSLKSEDILKLKTEYKTLMQYTDKILLEKLMRYLISNALKFSPNSPKVVVSVREQDSNIIVSVEDNGIGIPAEDRRYLFKPFFRGSNSSNFGGVGLGLSIVKLMVKRIGGSLSVQSRLHRGSIFEIRFPEKTIINYTVYSNLKRRNSK